MITLQQINSIEYNEFLWLYKALLDFGIKINSICQLESIRKPVLIDFFNKIPEQNKGAEFNNLLIKLGLKEGKITGQYEQMLLPGVN